MPSCCFASPELVDGAHFRPPFGYFLYPETHSRDLFLEVWKKKRLKKVSLCLILNIYLAVVYVAECLRLDRAVIGDFQYFGTCFSSLELVPHQFYSKQQRAVTRIAC